MHHPIAFRRVSIISITTRSWPPIEPFVDTFPSQSPLIPLDGAFIFCVWRAGLPTEAPHPLQKNYQEDEWHSMHLVICRQRNVLTLNDFTDWLTSLWSVQIIRLCATVDKLYIAVFHRKTAFARRKRVLNKPTCHLQIAFSKVSLCHESLLYYWAVIYPKHGPRTTMIWSNNYWIYTVDKARDMPYNYTFQWISGGN